MGDALLRIGQLAKDTGVSVDTIRHYERLGLLPKAARTNAGYRQYPPSALDRVGLVRHLQELALAFGHGDFEKPLMTHSEMPPGAATMQRLKAAVTYTLEAAERGGVVRIATSDANARDAIHDFLRYQIREHATGDPVTVQK